MCRAGLLYLLLALLKLQRVNSMADLYDQATDREIQEREIAISEARNSKMTISAITVCSKCGADAVDLCEACSEAAVSICIECGNHIAQGLRWCDKDCRDDWQRWNPGA